MNQRTRTIVVASLGAIAGAILATSSMFFLLIRPYFAALSESNYGKALAEAKLSVTELRLLRGNESSKLVDTLESMLDAQVLTAAQFEELNPSWRNEQAEKSIAVVRAYREQYPSPRIADKRLQDMKDRVAKALLPKEPAAAAP